MNNTCGERRIEIAETLLFRARSVIDQLMGDTDLDRDESDEIKVCQAISRFLADAPNPPQAAGEGGEKWQDYVSRQCNRYVNGECRTLGCLKRGGWDGKTALKDASIATCEAHEAITEVQALQAQLDAARVDAATWKREFEIQVNVYRAVEKEAYALRQQLAEAVGRAEKAEKLAHDSKAARDGHWGDCSIYKANPETGAESRICDCGYFRCAVSGGDLDGTSEIWAKWAAHQAALDEAMCASQLRDREAALVEALRPFAAVGAKVPPAYDDSARFSGYPGGITYGHLRAATAALEKGTK